ncbi:MAG: hypothetical protein RL329_3029 [Bacteroidota bacterium]|jgi:hypothetical protein
MVLQIEPVSENFQFSETGSKGVTPKFRKIGNFPKLS